MADDPGTPVIDRFRGPYAFLSNFYLAKIEHHSKTYPTVEHAYQAMKTLDKDERKKIRKADTPGKAKHFGRKATIRADWEHIKEDVMLTLVRKKFKNRILKNQLLLTGNAILIEGNNWGDTYWGQVNGVGKNKLGKILMKVRKELRGKK